MPATSNIKLFDENKTNMMNDATYESDSQREGGVQGGIASSSLQNKFQYQVSLVSYAIAQLMVNNGFDANDSDSVSTFVSNLSKSILQPKEMLDGIEYDTGRYCNGEKIYTKLILFDPTTFIADSPGSLLLEVNHGIANLKRIVRTSNSVKVESSGSWEDFRDADSQRNSAAYIRINDTKIFFEYVNPSQNIYETGTSYQTGWRDGLIILEYTKEV